MRTDQSLPLQVMKEGVEKHPKDPITTLTHEVMNLTQSIRELQSKLDSLDTPKTHEIDPELKEVKTSKEISWDEKDPLYISRKEILSTDDLVIFLGITKTTITEYRKEGMPHCKALGKIFFKKQDILNWLDMYQRA